MPVPPTDPPTPTPTPGGAPHPARAWDQQPDEPARQYEAFKLYRDLGGSRTVVGAYRVYTGRTEYYGKPKAFLSWARVRHWKERAEAFDRHLAAELDRSRREAFDRVGEEQVRAETDWAVRRAQHREEAWSLGDKLVAKARQMLEIALITRKTETRTDPDGRTVHVTTYNPAKWSFYTVTQMVETADKIKRMAAELPVTVSDLGDGAEGADDTPFFETGGQLDDALPAGAMPEYPVDPAAAPEIAPAARRAVSDVRVPAPARPGPPPPGGRVPGSTPRPPPGPF